MKQAHVRVPREAKRGLRQQAIQRPGRSVLPSRTLRAAKHNLNTIHPRGSLTCAIRDVTITSNGNHTHQPAGYPRCPPPTKGPIVSVTVLGPPSRKQASAPGWVAPVHDTLGSSKSRLSGQPGMKAGSGWNAAHSLDNSITGGRMRETDQNSSPITMLPRPVSLPAARPGNP